MISLPDRALLDRIIRGRAWIPLLGALLAGLVAMQVEVLKLGTNIGRSIERSTALANRNEMLQANVASLADDRRIERLAVQMGMVMPAPDAIGFLSAHPGGDAARAAANIHPPDSAGFLSLLYSNGAVVGAAGTSSTTSDSTGTSDSGASTPSPTTAATAPSAGPSVGATHSASGG